MVSFQRPKGAKADLRELEYISALHQTQKGAVNKDGSIQDVDIQLFVKSRYGIEVPLEDVRRLILHGFGGDDGIDLSEVVAILLMPTLKKAVDSTNGEQEQLDSSIVYPKPGLVQVVLNMILRDVVGSTNPPPKLTTSLLSDILLAYGEEELSRDTSLLRDMMNAAGTEGDDFDVGAFSRALTNDLTLYDVESEATLTTNYRDVMKRKEQDNDTGTTIDVSLYDIDKDTDDEDYLIEGGDMINSAVSDDNKKDAARPAKIRKFFSSPAIDFTSCRYSSKFIVVLLWTGFVISYVAYFRRVVEEEIDYQLGEVCADGSFGCRILRAILEWLYILATLCAFGLAYVAFSSIGNGIEDTKKWTRMIAVVSIGFFTWFFFLVMYRQSDEKVGEIYYVDENENVVETEDIILEESQPYESVIYYIALVIGNVLLLIEFYMMIGDSVRKRCFQTASAGVISFFTAPGIKAEARNKRAAALKINSIVDNARQIHELSSNDIDQGESSFGAGLLNFSVRGEEFENAGGFLWTWKRLLNKDLSQKEGIWISARLMAGNFAQLLISAFVLTYGIAFTRYVVEEWQKGKEDPSQYLYLALDWFNVLIPGKEFVESACDFFMNLDNGVLNASSVLLLTAENTTCANVALETINRTMDEISNSLYPQEQYMVEWPMIVATSLAFLTTLALAVVYVPSVASTTLQFRAGAIPFFRDDYHFELYRSNLDQVTILLGSMFWSSLYAAVFAGVLFGAILFLVLWQATSAFFVNLLAVLIGLVCTIGIKILLSVFLLRTAYAAFYRKRVNQVNFVSLALECIMIGFAVGTALARAVMLVLIAVLYIGRIDTPLLAPGVGMGPLTDRYPFIFRQDVLALEAHRHPFIDLMGKMYLTKLCYGGRFADRSGYCYRLIFTVALMPWLRKYRVMARPELLGGGGAGTDGSCNNASSFVDQSMLVRSTTILPRSSILYQSTQMSATASMRGGTFVAASNVSLSDSVDAIAELPLAEEEEVGSVRRRSQ